MRVFENKMLRIIFRPKSADVTGGLRKCVIMELHVLCCLPDIMKIK
jgi:hypothetical protein